MGESVQEGWQSFLKGERVRTDDALDLCSDCEIVHILGLAEPALRPPRFGLHQPASPYLQHLTDDSPAERAAILEGKVWRQTKEGYVEVEFTPPEPYWADASDGDVCGG